MKPRNFLAAVFFSVAGLCQAARAHDAAVSNGDTGADLFSSNGRYIRFYAGYDFSLLDDVVNGIQGTVADYKSGGSGVTVGSSTDRSGVVLGLEWGQRLDEDSSLSLDTEVVSSQADSFGQANSGNLGGETIGPNMVDAALRYSFDVIRAPGSRTSLSLGAGWYHAIVDFNSSFSQGVTASPEINGALTGDTLGGTVGLKEQLQVGGSFTLDLSVSGRYARFGQVVASDLSGYAARVGGTGPYTLALVNQSGYTLIVPFPSQQLLVLQSQGQARPAALDYTGFDGEVSFGFFF